MSSMNHSVSDRLKPAAWNRLTLGKRVMLATSLSFIVIVVCAARMWFNLNLLEKTKAWVVHTNDVVATTRLAVSNLVDMETGIRGFAVGGDTAFLEPYEAGRAAFDENIARLQQLVSDNPAQVARFKALQAEEKKWLQGPAAADLAGRKAVSSGEMSLADYQASFNRAHGKQSMDRMREMAAEIIQIEEDLLAERQADYDRAVASSRLWGSWVIGIAIAGGWILLFLNNRHTQKLLTRVADRLKDASQQVSTSASQVSVASQSLAEGANEQAASLEETSASLEEINSQAKGNFDNAESARSLAQDAHRATEEGTGQMRDMVSAMSDIQDSSANIAKIVKTIDEIAFQTNILALNAAVEAARAGEAGAGFAVVADEVRALAQRAAQAARETTSSIDDSISKSSRGADISARVSQTLTEVADKARQVADIVVEITTASHEQTQGIGQVGTAITQMEQVTQSNASGAEETAAAAQELDSQAATLNHSVSQLMQLIGGTAGADQPSSSPHSAYASARIPSPRDNAQPHALTHS